MLHSSSTYPYVHGYWSGTFTYSDDNGSLLAGTSVAFSFMLDDGKDGHFTGTSSERETMIDSRFAHIDGHVNRQRIIFTKEYPVAHYVDREGTHVTNHAEPGSSVLYKGTWNETNAQFTGSWKIIIPGADPAEPAPCGTWQMAVGQRLEIKEEAPIILSVQFQPEHLHAIYFSGNKGKLLMHPQHRISLMLFLFFICVAIICIGSLFIDPHPAFSVLAIGSVLFAGGLSILIHKSINAIGKWKKEIDQHIDTLCAAGPIELLINAEMIVQRTESITVVIRWPQIIDHECHTNYIYLSNGSAQWIYTKASMTDEDFELLKDTVERYVQPV